MRSWPGLTAIGAGLIHLGLAAGSPVSVMALLAAAGAAECAWGVAALARDPLPAPRVALAVLAALVGIQVAALLVGGHTHGGTDGTAPLGAITGAVVLDLAAAASVAQHLRWGSRPGRAGGALRFLAGTAAAAAVVAAVTASSLAGTVVGGPHPH